MCRLATRASNQREHWIYMSCSTSSHGIDADSDARCRGYNTCHLPPMQDQAVISFIPHNLIATSTHGILHSLLPTSSRNHCAPLRTTLSSPNKLLPTPSMTACAAAPAVEFMTSSANDDFLPSFSGSPYMSQMLLRGSNQLDRQSYSEITRMVKRMEQYRHGRCM